MPFGEGYIQARRVGGLSLLASLSTAASWSMDSDTMKLGYWLATAKKVSLLRRSALLTEELRGLSCSYACVIDRNVCSMAIFSLTLPCNFLRADLCWTHFALRTADRVEVDNCNSQSLSSITISIEFLSTSSRAGLETRCIVLRLRRIRSNPQRASMKAAMSSRNAESSLSLSLKLND